MTLEIAEALYYLNELRPETLGDLGVSLLSKRSRISRASRAVNLTIVEPDERAMDCSLRSRLFDSFAG
jgi:hypothetical protein